MILKRVVAVLIVLMALITVGCGGSHDNSVSGTQSVGPTTATVMLRLSDSVSRALDASVDEIRFTGTDAAGEIAFGPVVQARAAEQSWDIPVSVKRLVIEFLADDRTVGVYSVAVELTPGQTLVIEDPDFLDAASPLVQLQVTAASTAFPVEFNPRFGVFGTFADGSQADLGASVSWSVLQPELADIDSTGLLSPKSPGQITVRAEALDLQDDLVATITDASLDSVQVVPDTFQIPAATGIFLEARGVYSDGSVLKLVDGVTWSSNLEAIATVDSSGKVLGQLPGVAQISAGYRGRSGVSSGTITSTTLVELTVSPSQATVSAGQTSAFRAVGRFDDDTTRDITSFVTWGSSSAGVATVNNFGVATGTGPGQALIIATDLEATIMGSGTLIVTTTPSAPQVATTLVFTGLPQSVQSEAQLGSVGVSVLDQFGQPMPGATGTVIVCLHAPPALPTEEISVLAQTTSGTTGSSSGDTGSGNTGSGNTGSGNTGSGNTGSGNTGSGQPTGSGSGEPTGSGSGSGTDPVPGPDCLLGLAGTKIRPLVNGVATFDDLLILNPGTYVLKAEMAGAEGLSNIINVTSP